MKVCNPRSEQIRLDDLGVTVQYVLKCCNLLCTKHCGFFFFFDELILFYTNSTEKNITIKFSVIYSRYRFTSLKLSLTLELISEKEVLFFNLCAGRRVALHSYQTTPLTFTGLVMVFVFVTRYTFRALNVFDALCIFLWYFLMFFLVTVICIYNKPNHDWIFVYLSSVMNSVKFTLNVNDCARTYWARIYRSLGVLSNPILVFISFFQNKFYM